MTPSPHQTLTPTQALRTRAVVTVFITLLLSAIAAVGLATAMSVHLFSITERKRDLGLLGLCEFIPAAILVFVSGSIADRFDRRKVAVFGLAIELVAIAILMQMDFSKVRTAGPFLAIITLIGASRSAVSPAMRALVPAAAPEGHLTRVVATASATLQISAILCPVLGAFCYRWLSPQRTYAVMAALTLLALICARMIPSEVGRSHLLQPGEVEEKPTLRAAVQGLTTIRGQPILFGAIALDLLAVLFGGAVALIPAVSKEFLSDNPTEVGVLRAAGGIGATIVTVYLATRPLQRRIGKSLLIAVGVFGVATIAFGFSRSLWISIGAIALLSAADSVSVFVRSTLVPLVTPAAERGRVLAVEAVFIGASNELGAFESGEVAHHFGTTFSIVSGGILTCAVVALFWLAVPALRNIDRFEDLEQA